MVLMLARGEAVRPKTANGKPVSDFRQPRGQLNGQTDSSTGRDNLLFFRGDEEDEVRTTLSHSSMRQQVSTEESSV